MSGENVFDERRGSFLFISWWSACNGEIFKLALFDKGVYFRVGNMKSLFCFCWGSNVT